MHTDLPRGGGDGYSGGYLPLSSLIKTDERPMGFREGLASIVYLYSDQDPDKGVKFEGEAFDDRVGVTSRLFNCLRLCVDDISSDAVRKELKADRGPVVYVFSADGEMVKCLGGWTLKGATLYNVMAALVKSQHKLNMAAFLRTENELLKEIDAAYWKIEDARFDLSELKQRDGKSAERQIEKLEAEIAELEKQHEELKAKEEAFIKTLDASSTVAVDN
jgi:hypothetical protein